MRILLLTLLVPACASGESVSSLPESPLLASLQVFTAGEEVGFVLQVTNTSQEPLDLTFNDGQMYDFVVTDGSREVWRWSGERMFTQAVQVDRLASGESRRYEAVWRPGPGQAGELIATGVLTSSDRRVEQSTRIVLP